MERGGALGIDRRRRRFLVPVEAPVRPAPRRLGDFAEVKEGLSLEEARAEAARCLQCPEKPACSMACPAGNDIPRALWHLEKGEVAEAAAVFRETSNLPELCSRVCPQSELCQGSCVQAGYGEAVAIGLLERFVTDYAPAVAEANGSWVPRWPSGRRVAVVGAGPAGITVADELALRGHEVVVFDAWPKAGGTMRYGIPSFKLPKVVIDAKVRLLERRGVGFVQSTKVGADVTVDDLLADGFEAVFLGTGAVVSAPLKVPGADLAGIHLATPFLVKANLPPGELPPTLAGPPEVGRRVVVIGGGDTAMDCLRSALRLGADEAVCLYRRTEAQMPGNVVERRYARQEGVRFEWLAAPIEFLGDEGGHVRGVRAQRMRLGERDASGRRRPVAIEGSEFEVGADTVVLALGYWPDPLLGETTPGLETHDWGLVTADEATGRTMRRPIFAAGDNVHGPDLVVTAMVAARRAAAEIHTYLSGLGSASPDRAARKVCHAKVAHLTRLGNSLTPENTASFPRSGSGPGASASAGSPVTRP